MATSKEPLSDSALCALRAAISLAYADGSVAEVEKEVLRHYLDHPQLTGAQRAMLEKELNEGSAPLQELLPRITEARDRAHLINMARIIAHRDGVLDDGEDAAIKAMLAAHMPGMNW